MSIISVVPALGNQMRKWKKFKIDLIVQGVPQKAVCQDEDRTRRIRRSEEPLLIKDLQKTDTSNPFSEESKKNHPHMWTLCTTLRKDTVVNERKV